MPTTLTMADALRDIAAACRAQPRRGDEPQGVTTAEYAAYCGISVSTADRAIRQMMREGKARFAGKVLRQARNGDWKPIGVYAPVTKGK